MGMMGTAGTVVRWWHQGGGKGGMGIMGMVVGGGVGVEMLGWRCWGGGTGVVTVGVVTLGW